MPQANPCAPGAPLGCRLPPPQYFPAASAEHAGNGTASRRGTQRVGSQRAARREAAGAAGLEGGCAPRPGAGRDAAAARRRARQVRRPLQAVVVHLHSDG